MTEKKLIRWMTNNHFIWTLFFCLVYISAFVLSGREVREDFLEKSASFNDAFKRQGNGKWLADIYQLARIELAVLGIINVYGGTHCTFTEHERFYSYRRESQTGRMATLIWRE